MKKKVSFIIAIILIIISGLLICYYQTKKEGLHEDEAYTISSSVNPTNGLMSAYDASYKVPIWHSKEYVTNFFTLSKDNYFNLKAIYLNQAYDNHPPVYYTLVHFSTMFFNGEFNIYAAFIVNMIAFVLSTIILLKILKIINKNNLYIPTIILYAFSMGTISMIIYERMYMLLTMFVLLYFYLCLKIYKNDFKMNTKDKIKLGITTILGFLTQYFFAFYAVFITLIMVIEMMRLKKSNKKIIKYVFYHVIYATIAILLFVPCIYHLLFTDRGLSNIGNSNFLGNALVYFKHLLYAFSIDKLNNIIVIFLLGILAILLIYSIIKSKNKFIYFITLIPSLLFFIVCVKFTSYQELRYIMPMIPFIVLIIVLILDETLRFKYKEIIIIIICLLSVSYGLVKNKPRFLYENYKDIISIANKYSDNNFIYIYDNMFNHMQSVEEMMIYKNTLIINYNKKELYYVVNDNDLNKEDTYILSIKSYMDNNKILNEIKKKSAFKKSTLLYECDDDYDSVCNNIYLMSK